MVWVTIVFARNWKERTVMVIPKKYCIHHHPHHMWGCVGSPFHPMPSEGVTYEFEQVISIPTGSFFNTTKKSIVDDGWCRWWLICGCFEHVQQQPTIDPESFAGHGGRGFLDDPWTTRPRNADRTVQLLAAIETVVTDRSTSFREQNDGIKWQTVEKWKIQQLQSMLQSCHNLFFVPKTIYSTTRYNSLKGDPICGICMTLDFNQQPQTLPSQFPLLPGT